MKQRLEFKFPSGEPKLVETPSEPKTDIDALLRELKGLGRDFSKISSTIFNSASKKNTKS